ncbi:hypothetical protein DITRI_Ditri18aG0090800 [Diplodiscus trichospermus]
MALEKYQADHYLVLSPDKVSAWEVIRLLWSKKMERKAYNYIIIPESIEDRFLEKGLAISSLSAQKCLLHAAEPMKWFGEKLEKWLNLVSVNSNIFMLLLNKLRCKVNDVPDRESDAFMSFIGHLDSRVKLDENIQPGDRRYNSVLAAMAAKLAFENKSFVKKTVEEHWKGFMFYDQRVNMIVVAFRGTEPFNAYDWSTDADISCFENPEMGKIHGGFMKALGLVMKNGWPREEKEGKKLAYYCIREVLRKRLEANKNTKFLVTGHSLGGALAILFPAILALHEETNLLERLIGVYTFGQPRVGDDKFKNFVENQFDKYGIKYLRFVYCNDLIPRLPLHYPPLYTDFGTCIYFNSCYQGQILDDEPHKNHFSKFGWIRRRFNALLELLRSLYLPLLNGRDYREGLALILMVRFPALIFPGMADHNPLDYVNATRLGSIKIYEQVESSRNDSKKNN